MATKYRPSEEKRQQINSRNTERSQEGGARTLDKLADRFQASQQGERAVGVGLLGPTLIAAELMRCINDPECYKKLKEALKKSNQEQNERSERADSTTIDNILGQLLEAIGEEEQPELSPPTSPPITAPAEGKDPRGEPWRTRDFLAAELQYIQMIPPMRQELLLDFPESIRQFLKLLKDLDTNPFLSTQIDNIIAQILPTNSSLHETGNRIDLEDPELLPLAERMVKGISKDNEERVLPVAALLIGSMIAACTAGQTTGGNVYHATKDK